MHKKTATLCSQSAEYVCRQEAWFWAADQRLPEDVGTAQDAAFLTILEANGIDAEPWVQTRAYADPAVSGAGHVMWSGRSQVVMLNTTDGARSPAGNEGLLHAEFKLLLHAEFKLLSLSFDNKRFHFKLTIEVASFMIMTLSVTVSLR